MIVPVTKQFYFLSGLPRSGSTLLANILGQNPRFHVTATSGLNDVLKVVRDSWFSSEGHYAETKAPEERLRRVLIAIMQNYHKTERPVVIDKARSWLASLETTEWLLAAKSKILVSVRDVSEVLASFEILWRKQAHLAVTPNGVAMQTVIWRCSNLLTLDKTVGASLLWIQEALNRGFLKQMLFIEFDDLTAKPRATLEAIYAFLQEPPFVHDFQNVQQITVEDDSVYGLGDRRHEIRPRVESVPKRAPAILGTDFAAKFNDAQFWRQPAYKSPP